MPRLTLTVDLEGALRPDKADPRTRSMVDRCLDLCDEHHRRATFFIVGGLAVDAPDLVTRIAARGHEIAWHSRAHAPLTTSDPDLFRREAIEDKDRLEQLTGQPVIGFRAPRFSLTPQSQWATDVLAEVGFRYSSSVMPTRLSLFGYPGASRLPFTWPSGLMEFPMPTVGLGPLILPYLGGIYLFAQPFALTRLWLAMADKDACLWTYLHPYDLDTSDGFRRLPGAPLWISAVLYAARRRAEPLLRALLAMNSGGETLAERYAALT